MGNKNRELWVSAGGNTPDHWEIVSLEELLLTPKSISVGVMYPGKHDPAGVPLIKVGDVKDGCITSEPESRVSNQVDEEYKRTRLSGNELLITLVGNPGDCVVVTENMAGWNAARALAVLKLKDSDLREWIKLILVSHPSKHIIDSRLNTTVQKTLNLKDIKELPIPIPPSHEREWLCGVVGALEKKSFLNSQINKTLEQIAQALFKSWFVDFDPVIDNALDAGNPIPEALEVKAEQRKQLRAMAVKGEAEVPILPDDICSLFPSEFEFTEEMGWIPKGWKVSTVGGCFDVTMGQSPPGSTYNEADEGMPFFQGRADFGFRFPSNRVYCTEPKRFANKSDTLISVRAPVGDINMAMENCCIGRGVAAVRHKLGSRSYSYYAMNQLSEHFKVFESEGTVFGSINQKDFKALPQLEANVVLLKEFDQLVEAIDNKVELQSLEISNLTTLRDILLPKLISGELQIPDAEQLVTEALS